MSEETIRQHVSKFLEITDWGEVLADTCGAGLCYDVSEDFRKWLVSIEPGTNAYLLFEKRIGVGRFTGLYPPSAGGHWFLILENRWLVDLSARQFCSRLPIPYILDIRKILLER